MSKPADKRDQKALPEERRFLTLIMVSPPVVLLFCLIVTYFAWKSVWQITVNELHSQFNSKVMEIHTRIQERVEDYSDLLQGASGLFAASDSVERDEFHAYAEMLHLRETYPGIQGLGFSELISPRDKVRRVASIRKDGLPKFTIRPEGVRDLYTAIIYLEPFDWRNQRAAGYDMYSEPVRREAMNRARDRGEGALSGKVKLVQETESDVQSGFLMYFPIYRNNAPHATLNERRSNLLGWVYSPFRMGDLVRKGILGRQLDEVKGSLGIEIHDGRSADQASLMFDSMAGSPPNRKPIQPLFSSVKTVRYLGHDWTIEVYSLPSFEARAGMGQARTVAIFGGIISLLITLIVWLLSTTNARAIKLAEKMSESLAASARYTRNLIEASLDPLVTISPGGKVMDVNEATVRVTGHPRSELIGKEFSEYFTEPDKAREGYRQVFSEGKVTDYPLTIRHKDGHVTDVLYNASVYHDDAGRLQGVLAAARDVTQRMLAEKALYASREKLEQTLIQTIEAMAAIVEMRDPYTAGHQRRVADLSKAIALEMHWPSERIRVLYLAALIYEIGKIRIPAELLSKPGQLDDIEHELFKTHAQAGFEILSEIDFPWPIAQIVLQHHERLDGSGYPQGLKGNDILPESRILAVADVMEAMLSHRPYRPALSMDEALGEISGGRGVLYDPEVADACVRMFREHRYSLPA